MNEESIHANYNFIVNGEFDEDLRGWAINDRQKVTSQRALWQNKNVGFMNATNGGTGEQTITLATLPRPAPGRADYKLMFFYEAVSRAVGTLRISPGLGGEEDLRLVPSRKADLEPALGGDEVLLELNLVKYPHPLTLDPEEETVKFTVISPDNGGPGRPGAVRVAFVRVELLLEPLQLTKVRIKGKSQRPGDKLHLCFGADHQLDLYVKENNRWIGTNAGLLVNGGETDPESILDAGPPWGREQSVSEPWTISCAGRVDDIKFEHTLGIRSQYTADVYQLNSVSGHFQLDVIPVQEAAYYPVIDLDQQVDLRMRVESHYTKTPLANRMVTWTLKGPTGEGDVVLLIQPSDENGEAGFTWKPDSAGDCEIVASVDSYYKKEDARYAFKVRALQEDPWLSATFTLGGPSGEWVWGNETGYPCLGATHEVALALASGHALADTELALYWTGESTPEGLGIEFTPDLKDFNPVEGAGRKWTMVCGNSRDSQFKFNVSCSKLLEPSPLQTVELGHNWLEIEDFKLPTRFPSVRGSDLQLEVQIHSRVPGVGSVSGIDVQWRVGGGAVEMLPTGDEGWGAKLFSPVEEGPVPIIAKVASRFDKKKPAHRFDVNVLAENPWNQLVTVTLDGRREGATGLLCFRDADPVDLLIIPGDDTLLNEDIYLNLTNEGDLDLGFHFEPDMTTPRKLGAGGLLWKVRSTSDNSARFQLQVCHDELDPYELQGRLLSTTLEQEGRFELDGNELDLESPMYPCLGGVHTLRYEPRADSLMTGLDVAAKWTGASSSAFDMTLSPDHERALMSDGLEWTLDAGASTESGESGLSLELTQARFTFPALAMSLGHNRIIIDDERGPTFDPVVGETVTLEIKVHSFYTRRPVSGIEVSFSDGSTATPVTTTADGWARFSFETTQPGDVRVVAKVPSPYDRPEDAPTHAFEFTVLTQKPDSPPVSASTTFASEGLPMPEEQLPGAVSVEIGEVREASLDPVVGESVGLALKVRLAGTQRAAADVGVIFAAEQERTLVVTDGEGWARFAYTAEQAKDVEVVATLEGVNDRADAVLSHTFKIKTLAESVWGTAKIQLNNEVTKPVWGVETLFPQTGPVHTLKLTVDDSNSHLLGRDICLGLTGYSSHVQLGLNINPALGIARPLTADGLSWSCSGSIGGAYDLQLEAYRILKKSPVNAMSLGPVSPEDLIEG